MGSAGFTGWTNVQLQAHIRTVAQDSASVLITRHADGRMRGRRVGIAEVYECLRYGAIVRPWQVNAEFDTIECRMERYVGGREVGVVVALDDADPDFVVVTVVLV